jgi:hypothetical protein
MGLLLALSQIYMPGSIRKSRLNELFRATADAFQRQAPHLVEYSLNQCLTKYALFTAENAEESIRQGNESEVKERLYYGARRIGQNIREQLNVQTLEEVMQACEVIYKALKIEFRGDSLGQIRIRSCFFSAFYSSDVCRIISSLDEGLVAGLSGDLKLKFSQRITEGMKCCQAHIITAGSSL